MEGLMKRQTLPRFFLPVGILAASLLACRTAPLTGFFATPTSTATLTLAPTSTPLPTATQTSAPAVSPVGTDLETLDDHTTRLIDRDYHYQLILPEGWSVIRSSSVPSQMDPARKNPALVKLIAAFEGADERVFRFLGIEADQKYLESPYPTYILIQTDADPFLSIMPMAAVTAGIEDRYLNNASIIGWDVKNTPEGLELGINDATRMISMSSGINVKVLIKVISFQSDQVLIMLQIFTPEEFSNDFNILADEIIGTIELTTP